MEHDVSFYVSYFNKVIYKLEKILMRTRMMKFKIMSKEEKLKELCLLSTEGWLKAGNMKAFHFFQRKDYSEKTQY